MALTDEHGPSIPFDVLHPAVKTIVWGVVLSSVLAFTTSTSSSAGHSSIDLVAVVGLPLLWFGLRSLPTGQLPAGIGSRANVITVLVAICFAANIATLVPSINVAAGTIGQLAECGWQILLLFLAARLTAHIGADVLSRTWQTLAWLFGALVVVATAATIGFMVTDQGSPPAGTYRLGSDDPQSGWVLVAAATMTLAGLTLGIAIIVATVRTLRVLRAGRLDAPQVVGLAGPPEPAVPEAGEGAPRLGRRDDRLIYYVDPDPPTS